MNCSSATATCKKIPGRLFDERAWHRIFEQKDDEPISDQDRTINQQSIIDSKIRPECMTFEACFKAAYARYILRCAYSFMLLASKQFAQAWQLRSTRNILCSNWFPLTGPHLYSQHVTGGPNRWSLCGIMITCRDACGDTIARLTLTSSGIQPAK